MSEITAPSRQAGEWLRAFEQALAGSEPTSAVTLFGAESYWRDLVAFTWNIKTAEGDEAIAAMLGATAPAAAASGFALEGEAKEADGVVEAWFGFQTAAGPGRGLVRLRDGRCWTLLTTLTGLHDHPEPLGFNRPKGVVHGADRARETWLEAREAEQRELGYSRQPYCLIVGGGQGGIGLAARLRQLDVPTLIVEKNARPGDSWRNRYKSLCLHDPVWYDHLPYLPFPDNWPVFAPKDKLGDWLEMYTRVMELNYWGSTVCRQARYDEVAGEWEVHVNRDGKDVVLRPKQLVLATGMSGVANMPEIPGAECFEGDLHHSSQHPGPDAYAGKHCVVLGSNNSAHDISAALWEQGAQVTMIQRSSTHIVKSDSLMEVVLGPLYSEEAVRNGIDHDTADLIFASIPYRILPGMQKPAFDVIRERDAEFYRRLDQAGFLLDFGADDSGLFLKYLRRGSGYYIDVGASELVASGEIALRSGVTIERINPRSVTLSDGSELPADLIVCATGYGSMNGWAARLISQEVADRVGKCWGLGSDTPKDPGPWEGELRNMWKPTQQPGLWFHGGNLHQSRHYSRFLALQLKARQAGLETPVYGLPEVHHRC
jgi:putative flavoprotein involved in K+ transport